MLCLNVILKYEWNRMHVDIRMQSKLSKPIGMKHS